MVGSADALTVALDIYAQPHKVAMWRQLPLPDDVGALLRVASGQPESVERAAVLYAVAQDELIAAARFFVEQLMLARDVAHDPWRVLGARPDAPDALLREHRHWLMRLVHPDRSTDWADAYAMRVQDAWRAVRAAPEARTETSSRAQDESGGSPSPTARHADWDALHDPAAPATFPLHPVVLEEVAGPAQRSGRSALVAAVVLIGAALLGGPAIENALRSDESQGMALGGGYASETMAEATAEPADSRLTDGTDEPVQASAKGATPLAPGDSRSDESTMAAEPPANVQTSVARAPQVLEPAHTGATRRVESSTAARVAPPTKSQRHETASEVRTGAEPKADVMPRLSSVNLSRTEVGVKGDGPNAVDVAHDGGALRRPDGVGPQVVSASRPSAPAAGEVGPGTPSSAVSDSKPVANDAAVVPVVADTPALEATTMEPEAEKLRVQAAVRADQPVPSLASRTPVAADGAGSAEPVAKPVPAPTLDEALGLVRAFQRAYAETDMRGLLALFAAEAHAGRGGRASLAADYSNLFRTSTSREIDFRGLRWRVEGSSLVGSGGFEARLSRSDRVFRQKITGSVRLEVVREDGVVRFLWLEPVRPAT